MRRFRRQFSHNTVNTPRGWRILRVLALVVLLGLLIGITPKLPVFAVDEEPEVVPGEEKQEIALVFTPGTHGQLTQAGDVVTGNLELQLPILYANSGLLGENTAPGLKTDPQWVFTGWRIDLVPISNLTPDEKPEPAKPTENRAAKEEITPSDAAGLDLPIDPSDNSWSLDPDTMQLILQSMARKQPDPYLALLNEPSGDVLYSTQQLYGLRFPYDPSRVWRINAQFHYVPAAPRALWGSPLSPEQIEENWVPKAPIPAVGEKERPISPALPLSLGLVLLTVYVGVRSRRSRGARSLPWAGDNRRRW